MKKKELYERAMRTRSAMDVASDALDDSTAIDAIDIFRTYESLVEEYNADNTKKYEKGYRFRYGDRLLKTEQPITIFDGIFPPVAGTESMYSEVSKPDAGFTVDSPIEYNNNMELIEGMYYAQSGITYVCTRSTGVPVYNNLSDLINIYVNVVS